MDGIGIGDTMNRRIHSDSVVKDNFTTEVFDSETGELLWTSTTHNLVTTAGKNLIRDAINTGASPKLTHLAIGNSDTAPVVGDTTLAGELARYAFTSTTTGAGQLTILYALPSANLNGNTLKNAGLLTAAVAGSMYAEALILPTITKTAAIYVNFTWVLTWT